MALNRWRRRFDGNQRVDLPDFRTMMDRAFEDFRLLIKTFIDNQSTGRVLRRYKQGTHATNIFKIKKDFNRALMDQGQEWLYVNTDAANTTENLAVLNNVTNYIEVRILFINDDLQTRAFWDTDIGLTGEEFFDQINVRTRIDENFQVAQGSFTGGQWLPLFEVDVDGTGAITAVREMDDAFWKPRAYTLPAAAARPDVFISDVQDMRSFLDFLAALMSEVKGTGQSLESMSWSNIKLLREYQNIFFTGGGEIDWEASGGPDTLTIGADIGVEVAGRADLLTFPAGALAIGEGECVYVDLPETGVATLTPVIVDFTDVPINPTAAGHSPRILVMFYRKDNVIYGTMDIPELSSGETGTIGQDLPKNIRARLGITGESSVEAYSAAAIASGVIGANDSYPAAISKLATRSSLNKVDYIDLSVTPSPLPTGAPFSVDGNTIADGDEVLFTHPTLNKVYRATVVSGNVTAWVPQTVFNGSTTPQDGDEVSVIGGTDYLQMVFRFNTTLGWKPLNTSQLEHEPTGFINREESSISFDEGTRTLTIEPKAPSLKFDYATLGKVYRKESAQSIAIPDVTGLYFFYFDGETLVQSSSYSYDIIKRFAFVATVYWDASDGTAVLFGDERHGLVLDGATHRYLHTTVGMRWVSGLTAGDFSTSGDGNDDENAQISFSDGLLYDEDLDISPVNSASPTEPFEQVLSPIAQVPILYRGTDGLWLKEGSSDFPVKFNGNELEWNNPAGPWSLEPANDGEFIAMWIFGTNDPRHPIVAILGQRADASLSAAQAGNTYESLQFGDLPSLEMKVLYRLIFEFDSSNFGNSVTSRLVDVRDLRQAIDTSIAAFSASDHGGLTGLNDPDHGPTAVTTTGVTKDGGLSDSDVDVKQSLDTLNKLFGQLRIKPHPTLPKRVIITGSDRALNSGTNLIQTLRSLVMSFEGAEIDFSTGEVFQADGTTPLPNDFTPAVLPGAFYFFYSVNILASTVNANNTISAQILVLPASAGHGTFASAPRPVFVRGAINLGTVFVQEAGGNIANLDAANISQLGTGGSGGGSGNGDANSFLEDLKARLRDSFWKWLTPNIFSQQEETLVDVSSTGSYDIASAEYDISVIGNTLVTKNLLGTKFKESDSESVGAELHVLWNVEDPLAVYEMSLNGGSTWEAVTMNQIAGSKKYVGEIKQFNPASVALHQYDVINASATKTFNATTQQFQAMPIVVGAGIKQKTITGNVYLSKLGVPTGDLYVRLVKDNAGAPSLAAADILAEASPISIGGLSAGNNTVPVSLSARLAAGTYWLLLVPSDYYRSTGFSAGVNELQWRTDTSSPSYTPGALNVYDGSVWAPVAGEDASFQINGFAYDLRVRVTSGTALVSLNGIGVLFSETGAFTKDTPLPEFQRFLVSGSSDQTVFTMTQFVPDPTTLRVVNGFTGQTHLFGDFSIQGRDIIFPSGTFLFPGDVKNVVFDQRMGFGQGNDRAMAILASNSLGSTDPQYDLSQAGKGILLKRPDGVLRMLRLDNSDNIVIESVP